MKYCGIDLHSNNAVVAVTDDHDRVLYCKRLANDFPLITAALAPHRADLQGVVVESTYNWYWLVDGLMAAGYAVHLANTAAIKQYEGLKYAGDERDAVFLAHLFRLGLLPQGYIYPPQDRALRDLARKRLQLVQQRTMNILSIENILARQLNLRLNAEQVRHLDTAALKAFHLPSLVERALIANLAVLGTLQSQILALETVLHNEVKLRPEFQILKTAPGIGDILAATIMLESGTILRFPGVGQFSSYCRCVDAKRISNGKKKGQGNAKNGNRYLAWAFIEAAAIALRSCPPARRFYERKKARRMPVVAMKALAHKLARAAYYMLRDGKPFEVTKCFG
ncbi:IS110 family RNA-guided transposase [Cupriavidus metallidurans]|jgi:transposase|uniref:IS110 family transposase n=1 Tax=Cupriavidus metallidurans TaxID=119219 RepID=A0A482J1Q7_9BURK|nr:IS110 family transposase [Cupriavidus metallidurans]QBP13489.1 IS110 family transposase [Cupriavidus metallidurans]